MAIETQENGTAEPAPVAPAALADTAPVETGDKPAEKPPEPPVVDKFGPKFAALARREKANVERERSIKEREAKIAALESLPTKAKENPLQALESLGLSYEQITEYILNQGEPPKTEDKLAALERRIAEKEAKEIEAREAAAVAEKTAIITNFQSHLTATITAAGDKYELINALGQHDEVFSLIEAYHEKNGALLSIEDAANAVEQHLEADTRKRLGLKKFAPAPEKTAPSSNGYADRENSGTTTLTNRATSAPPPLSGDELPLDPDERTAAMKQRFRLWE